MNSAENAENAKKRGLKMAVEPEKTKKSVVEAKSLALMRVKVIIGIICNNIKEWIGSNKQ